MKKILSLIITFILIVPMSVSSFALTIDKGDSESSEVTYQVFYWLQNADDDGYTFAGNVKESGKVGDPVVVPESDPVDVQFPIDVRKYDGSLPNEEQFNYISRNVDKTNSLNNNKKVSSDGSTIVNVFYDRNEYTLEFEPSDGSIPEASKFKFKDKNDVYSSENPYKFTARFEENIGDKWPSSDKVDLLNEDENIIEDITVAGSKNYNNEQNFYYKYADKQYILNKKLADNCELKISKANKNADNQYQIKTLLENIDLDNDFYEDDQYSNKSYEPTDDGYFTQVGIKGFTEKVLNRAVDSNMYNRNKVLNRAMDFINMYYNRNRYNIDFYSDYDKLNNEKIQAKFEKNLGDVEKPDHGTKEGYDFTGWSVPEINGDTVNFKLIDTNKEKIPSHNLHLFAKWSKKSTGGGGGSIVDPLPPPPVGKTVILASGEKYTDVLTATVLGNEKNAPILLSNKDSVTPETLEELNRLKTEDVIISGGVDSISDKVVDQLKDYNVTRIAGQDRYETSVKIGNEVRALSGNNTEAMLVDGTNFPDVITISSLASGKRSPILITEPNKLNKTTQETLKSWKVDNITIGGSYDSVSKNIEDSLNVSSIKRLGGMDRYETACIIGDEIRKLTGSKDDMILVDGTDFPDGITINSIASRYKAPIMLTNPKTITKITSDKIKEWSIKNVLIAGGYNSVSKAIEDGLGLQNVERVAGKDRYETAVKIAQRLTEANKALGGQVTNN